MSRKKILLPLIKRHTRRQALALVSASDHGRTITLQLEWRLIVFMFIHGGGWVLGDFPTHERFVRDQVPNPARPRCWVLV